MPKANAHSLMEFVMGLSKILMAAAVATMSVTPAIAAPANTAAVSDSIRAVSNTADSEELRGGSVIIALLAAAAIIAGILLLASNNSDIPTSP